MTRFLTVLFLAAAIASPLHARHVPAGATQRADTLDDLRRLPVPSPASSDLVELAGYYAPADKGPVSYHWDEASTLVDDGGAVIQPEAKPAAGRWLLLWDHQRAVVTDWGAGLGPAQNDLPAITRALAALAPASYAPAYVPPPSKRPVPGTRGTVYFPGTARNYRVDDEIIFTNQIALVGAEQLPTIELVPGSAPATLPSTKYVLRQCPIASDTGLNNEFSTCVRNLNLLIDDQNASNLKSASALLFTSEGSFLDRLAIQGWGQEGMRIHTARGRAGYLSVNGANCASPGIIITGEGFECTMISGGLCFSDGTHQAPVTVAGHVLPAVLLKNAYDIRIGTVNGESSPLVLGVQDSMRVNVGEVFANNCRQLVDIFGGSHEVNVGTMMTARPTGQPLLTDTSNAFGVAHNVVLNDSGTGIASYAQQKNVDFLSVGSRGLAVDGPVHLAPQASAPAAPPSGVILWTSSADGKLHALDRAGTDHPLW